MKEARPGHWGGRLLGQGIWAEMEALGKGSPNLTRMGPGQGGEPGWARTQLCPSAPFQL